MNRKHLLIPIDSSPHSNLALGYVAMMFQKDDDITFHLIHCQKQIADSVIPQPLDSNKSLLPDAVLGTAHSSMAKRLVDKKIDFLQHKGIGSKRIEATIVNAGTNIALSLISEAEKILTDSVVIARRGVGFIGEMVMGSLSAALFRDLNTIPLWIIDGEINHRDILVAVDGSIHSLRAVEHLAFILRDRSDLTIYLYHCTAFLAPAVVCSLDSFYNEWDKEWCDKNLSGDGCLFNGPAQLLIEAGIPRDRVVVLPETTHIEESTSIISQATKHGCGTIVIGRKGPGSQKGFFGGVSNRTIRQTQNMAVWIVGSP